MTEYVYVALPASALIAALTMAGYVVKKKTSSRSAPKRRKP